MKALKIFLTCTAALGLLSACTKEPDESRFAYLASVTSDDPSFVADDTGGSVTFSSKGGSVVLDVDCGTEWEAVNDSPEWLEANVSLNSGTLTLVTVQSTNENEQTATVTLQTSASGVRFATINVSQSPYATPTISSESPYFTVTDEGGTITFKTEGGEVVLNVDSELDWTVDNNAEDYFTAAADSDKGTLTVTAEQNTVAEELTGTLTLKAAVSGSKLATIAVTQSAYGAPEINVDMTSCSFPAVGTLTSDVKVTATADWTAEASDEWFTATKGDDETLTITVSENEDTEQRTGKVTLTCTDGISSQNEFVNVIQDARAYITLSSETAKFSAHTSEGTVTVESNYDWDYTYETSDTWFTVSRTDDGLTIAVNENESEDARESVITITAGDGAENTAEAELTVRQSGDVSAMIFEITTTSNNAWGVIPIYGTVDCTIDWGDDSDPVSVTTSSTAGATHQYATAGVYTVTVTGTVTELNGNSNNATYKKNLTAVKQWGETGLTNMYRAFYSYSSLVSLPEETGESFKDVTSFESAFNTCSALEAIPDGIFDDCPKVTSFATTFSGCTKINYVPEGLFDNCPDVTTYNQTFNNCTSLESVPDSLFVDCVNVTTFAQVFNLCSALKNAPSFRGCSSVTSFQKAFYNTSTTTALESVPANIFKGCTAVTDMSYIFQGCVSLTSVPEGIFDDCTAATTFAYVFDGATALTTVPAGLFKKATNCTNFSYVFYNSGLTAVPEDTFANCHAATNLSYAFQNCANLTSVPGGIFNDCTSVTNFQSTFQGAGLTAIPEELFDKNTEATNFSSTFNACASLTSVPAGLFSNTAGNSFGSTFQDCSALASIGGAIFPATGAGMTMTFQGCSSLTSIPSDLFAGIANKSFNALFKGCSSLKTVPSDLFKDCSAVTLMSGVFQDCSSLTTIEKEAFKGLTAATSFATCFQNCTSLTELPSDLFSCETFSKVTTAANVFNGCTNLKSLPDGLFSGLTACTNFGSAFYGCTSLTEIPADIFKGCINTVATFTSVFYGCTGLTKVPSGIFSSFVDSSGNVADCTKLTSVQTIFYNCTSLEEIPEDLFSKFTALTTLTQAFADCSSLKSLPAGLFDNNLKIKTLTNMFNGCSALTGESPYTVVDGTTYHLYERSNNTSYFTNPSTHTGCFSGCTGLSDYDAISSAGWN